MKILFFSRSEWSDTRSFGNTFTNLFEGKVWKDDIFSNIYMRNALPQNPVCRDYYQITVGELFKKCIKPEKIGKYFSAEQVQLFRNVGAKQKSEKNEKELLNLIHRLPLSGIYTVCEWMMRQRSWENSRFIAYLQKFDPDIFITYLGDDGIIYPMVEAVQKYTHAKIVLYGMDDLYGACEKYGPFRRKPALRDFKKALYSADQLYAISEELKQGYERKFGRDMRILQKGCEFDPLHMKSYGPVRFIYAGNLRYGREQTLAYLVRTLQKANMTGHEATLEIYTGAEISNALGQQLNVPGVSSVKGLRPYSEIRKLMNAADVVLEIESFEPEQVDYIHFSFSTKITDCLQSGSVPLAIGPADTGSIEYMRKIPGAVVIDDPSQIEEKVIKMLENRSNLPDMAQRAREFAKQHHDRQTVQENLRRELIELSESKSR